MYRLLIVLFFILTGYGRGQCQLVLPSMFSDHMVLQQLQPIPIWGTGKPGDSIQVKFAGEIQLFSADSKGRWAGRLSSLPAGGPYVLEVHSKEQKITLSDVMIGEVWLASGQSNMEFPLIASEGGGATVAHAVSPKIRFFQVDYGMNSTESPVVKGTWKTSNPSNAPGFSAVAYHFAKQLAEKRNVAVGIIQSAWGGTPIEPWIGKSAYDSHFHLAGTQEEHKGPNPKLLYRDYLANVDAFEKAEKGIRLGVHLASYRDADWEKISFPLTTSAIFGQRTQIYIPGCYIWFRNHFVVKNLKSNAVLQLSQLKGQFELYLNGKKIEHSSFEKHKSVVLQKELLKTGENILAIKLRSIWADGILGEDPSSISLQIGKHHITLNQGWLCNAAIEPKYPDLPQERNHPGVLFNAMIAPLIPYGIKGVIWYQGEANTWRPQDYNFLFPMLINDWRIRWQQGYFPFLFVQLPNFQGNDLAKADDSWAVLREAQRNTLSLPNTGMAVTIDVGDPVDIHPKRKREVGERMFQNARYTAYQDTSAVGSGPIFKSMEIKSNEVWISFDYAESGLTSNGNTLQGFSLANDDGVFQKAYAEIVGQQVKVYVEGMSKPKHVRYGWAANPTCNLYNVHQLPASPFRSGL
jgi:sialate O-acetylesterase